MKYLDFASLLDSDPAHIAFLSTFQFDPDFFERRLLRCETLAKARRIAVFIDASHWHDLLRRDILARWLNRRYLVVPITRSSGVFHPKLNLILTEKGGQVLCGSNNLTRSGCTSNLELLNAVPFDFDNDCSMELALAKEAFEFFKVASKHTDEGIGRIINEWISETAQMYPWLKKPNEHKDRSFLLLHTYDGSIWDRLVEVVEPLKPKKFFIISPFHDSDAGICRRLTKQWPRASIEFLVQQGYTNLQVQHLKKLRNVQLSELKDSSRRLHAKLLAWTTATSTGCLVGSANFTSAAFDGRNVETCLLLKDADGLIESLFDRQLAKKPLALENFESGPGEDPESKPGEIPNLLIKSAILKDAGRVVVNYSHQMDEVPKSLRLAIRAAGESRPRVSLLLPNKSDAITTVALSDGVFADAHGTLLASLVAELDGKREESLPVWIIQEGHLTYDPGEGTSSTKSTIEETGEGLPEYIDELGNREGLASVVDYLKRLNIRFHDGAGAGPRQSKFSLKIHDPYHPDVAPDWLIEANSKSEDLEKAIYEFVDRHIQKRMHKHARRGNVNGMENFLDIFTTLVRLLYIYYKRGIVKRPMIVHRLGRLLLLATIGSDIEEETFNGYLNSVFDHIGRDVYVLQEVCDKTHYLAKVRAALLIIQEVRFNPNESVFYGPKPTRPREVLPLYTKAVDEAIHKCDLNEPEPATVRCALEDYRMFSEGDIDRLLKELPERLLETHRLSPQRVN